MKAHIVNDVEDSVSISEHAQATQHQLILL